MAIVNETIVCEGDGVRLVNDFYYDDAISGPRPGVLVHPDARGYDDHTKNNARRLASLGFAAMACDLHGEQRYYPDGAEAIALVTPMAQKPARMRARARAEYEAFIARPEVDSGKVASIGYCMGGNMSVELARDGVPLAAAVGFHGGVTPPSLEDSKKITGKVLICTGASDPFIPLESRARFEKDMTEAGVDWRMHVYGGVYHSFTNKTFIEPEGDPVTNLYDESANNRSWNEMMSLFKEVFG